MSIIKHLVFILSPRQMRPHLKDGPSPNSNVNTISPNALRSKARNNVESYNRFKFLHSNAGWINAYHACFPLQKIITRRKQKAPYYKTWKQRQKRKVIFKIQFVGLTHEKTVSLYQFYFSVLVSVFFEKKKKTIPLKIMRIKSIYYTRQWILTSGIIWVTTISGLSWTFTCSTGEFSRLNEKQCLAEQTIICGRNT